MWTIIKKNKVYFSLYGILLLISGLILCISTKKASFLFINGHYNRFFDLVFQLFTAIGNGYSYVVLILVFLFIRYRYSATLLTAFVIQTLIVQSFKYFILPDVNRPLFLINVNEIHIVKGVNVLLYSSFPSGHTATAFSIFTLLILIIKNKNWSLVFLLLACGVGYSRMYLAQHFLIDVYFGSMIGVLTALVSYYLFNRGKAGSGFLDKRIKIGYRG